MVFDEQSLNSRPYSLTARWVFPISGPPLEHGVLEIDGGRITAIHQRPAPDAVDLGQVALLPGLINAHTHLEFSDLTVPVQPARPFTEWIRSLVGVRRTTPATAAVLRQGLAESADSGTCLLGEIATQDWPATDYQHPGLQTVVFRELIGMLPERAAAQLEIARNWLTGPADADPQVTRGLSPHAPYSVHPDLYRNLVQLAADHGAPVAVHLAETHAELELLAHGTGEFVAMLERFNAWDPAAIAKGTRPLDYLMPLESVGRALVVHGNYLGQEEIDWLAQHPQVSVVYCPRTHAFFGHTPHPWLQLLERGVNVALGTDSRGSNPDLNLWRELQFLARQFPAVNPATILTLGTLGGARALGRQLDLGTLEPGRQACLTVVSLPETSSSDPYQTLFSGTVRSR